MKYIKQNFTQNAHDNQENWLDNWKASVKSISEYCFKMYCARYPCVTRYVTKLHACH